MSRDPMTTNGAGGQEDSDGSQEDILGGFMCPQRPLFYGAFYKVKEIAEATSRNVLALRSLRKQLGEIKAEMAVLRAENTNLKGRVQQLEKQQQPTSAPQP